MKKNAILFFVCFTVLMQAAAQVEPKAGTWKPWFIASGKQYRLPAPSPAINETGQVLSAQANLSTELLQQIQYWNAGDPGYRWHEMMNKLWVNDTSTNGVLANLLLNTAIYDATLAAWDTKYTFKRPRPFLADKRVRLLAPRPESPSYPCEYSVAAGVAAAIFSHFYPALADSVNRLAQQLMATRIAAGVAFPSDTRDGFALGKQIAEIEIEHTLDFTPKTAWDGKRPDKSGIWNGKFAMFPTAGKSRTIVLDSGSQFRPGPPPDFAKDMAELKAYKQTFRSKANAFYYATQNFNEDLLTKKMFEYNLNLNPPRAARLYAAAAVASYDAFVACWDAKYAYWGIRPDQYDTTYRSLVPSPPFPGYPSGHAVMCGMMDVLYGYFFPNDKAYFAKKAKEGAESRFQAGIHFRTDNEVGLDLGRKVSATVVQRLQKDGADDIQGFALQKEPAKSTVKNTP